MTIDRRGFMRALGVAGISCFASRFAHAQQKTRIAFANYNDEASFGALVLRGMQQAAKLHPEFDVSFYDNRQDAARAVEVARTLATVKPDVFIEYNSIVPQANPQVARILKDAGVPILSIQVRVPGTPLYAVDNLLAGRESGRGAAEAARKRFGDAEKSFLLLTLPEGGPLFQERTTGAREGIHSVFPGAALEEVSTKNDPAVARQVTSDFLTKNPGRKVVIWAHVDAMAIAALTAARSAGREADIVIGSTGGEAIAFPEIRRENSPLIGTFSFFPEKWGSDLLPLAARLAKGETLADVSRPSQQLFITSENIDQFYPRG